MQNVVAIKEKLSQTVHQTCASALVETLVELGVDSVFGYPGASVLSIYNELSKENRITHYLARHEQAAIHAAEGYARTSGKVGVVLVTSGPGFTNTLTGIVNAYTDSTPLVILAGDVSVQDKSYKIFQRVDIEALASSCAKKTYLVKKSDDIKSVIKNAFEKADSGVKGPVVVALPRNILETEYRKRFCKKSVSVQFNYNYYFDKFSELINKAEKPIVLVGGGCTNSSEEIQKFVSKLNCPVVSTLMGIGNFPTKKENYLGMIGINGAYTANAALNHSDLIIAMGVAFSDRSTCKNINFGKKTKIISINLNKISKDFLLEINCDIKDFLKKFDYKNIIEKNRPQWLSQVESIKAENTKYIIKENNNLHSSFVLKTLSEYTKKYEPIVVTDVGQHQMLTAQFFEFNKPRKFITSGGLGTMGFGLPAAIGAHIANPDNLILNITGDGSFQMNLQELATCREHNIPIKIIIMNNGYLGMVRQMQEKIYHNNYQVEMTNPDFTKIAEAYDLFAIRVTRKNELLSALQKAIAYNGTAIVDIMIDSFENI
ncbi:biosynthetic-type acetolactate synthase large subunit [bacterium]|nr:biosynthetic-type acetolactate synthase large subunit [bacterium]